MPSTWKETRSRAAEIGKLDEAAIAKHKDELRSATRAYKLSEIRKSHALNQKQVAELMKVTQSRVSQIESKGLDETQLATVKSYVEAIGGRMRIVADFGDETITIG